MHKNRILITAATFAVGALALSGCSGGGGNGDGGSDGDASTLTVLDYYNNEPDKTLMQTALDSCAEQVGVTIDRETVPGADLIQTVLQRAQSKTMPDVLMLDNPDVQEIAATGGLAPLSEFDVDTSPFTQAIIDAATYEGEVYGLGPAVNTLGLFYNADLLAEKGIEPPTTWDELKEAAAALTEGDRYGLAFSAIANYEGTWQFLPFMWSNGGDETELDSPENAEALQLWVDLINDGSVSQGAVNWTQGDVKDQFMAGKAAMMVNGPWQIPSLTDADFEWASVEIPVNKAGEDSVAPLGGEIWTVPETGNDATKAKAAEFVECMSSEDSEMAIAKARYLVPTRTDIIDQYISEVPEMAAFGEQIKTARARTGKLGADWPDAATVIYNAIQLGITGTPADEAFAKAAQG
ncbi:sugar ABC transporter substrate-binding protein [Microbacterium sorbitolivorans]|uniref:Extracellular solute-binding protein n=1 Tax=Microbacterium sorbitolivorans TaxID=1867410 RepID=A0A367Y0W9_9MICO|nr:extracellular solute-binding protein [Microbacterium sorbitolivorans]RCK58671.1 extracellular solute-binding protein [Microbacterium sorbitolivorans]GGF38420.1 sugar ABC transporter substrate-binding protein [Microbacterium sorbitolivorans]